MKITAMVRSHSNDQQTAFRTNPPLSKEVFHCALKHYFGENWADAYSEQDGLFIVRKVGIPKEQIAFYEQSLSSAADLLSKHKDMAKKEREDTLQARADNMDLPLE